MRFLSINILIKMRSSVHCSQIEATASGMTTQPNGHQVQTDPNQVANHELQISDPRTNSQIIQRSSSTV